MNVKTIGFQNKNGALECSREYDLYSPLSYSWNSVVDWHVFVNVAVVYPRLSIFSRNADYTLPRLQTVACAHPPQSSGSLLRFFFLGHDMWLYFFYDLIYTPCKHVHLHFNTKFYMTWSSLSYCLFSCLHCEKYLITWNFRDMFISRFWCAHISRHLNFAIMQTFYILNHFNFAFLSTTIYILKAMLFNMSVSIVKHATAGLNVNSNTKVSNSHNVHK